MVLPAAPHTYTWFFKQHLGGVCYYCDTPTGVYPESLEATVSPIIQKPLLILKILKIYKPVSKITYLPQVVRS